MPEDKKPRILILGAGFAGLNCARGLKNVNAEITVVDKKNHHLFQPLLYQVASATLSPAEIATPIRSVLRNQRNTEVLLAEVTAINLAQKFVSIKTAETSRDLSYDFLVVATGARGSYFGHDEWEAFAPGLKSIPDATAIRQKVLLAFEAAEMEESQERRSFLLHFILVGGGPTGVEMAGAISELANIALVRDFRRIHPSDVRITLIEAGPRILSTFPEFLSQRATEDLKRLGVDVLAGTRVMNISQGTVEIEGKKIHAATIIWTAGVAASPAGQWLGSETDRGGRVKVTPQLQLPQNPNVFVIGDTAYAVDETQKPLPGVAPVAMQQGKYVANAIKKLLKGDWALPAFHYVNKGNLATIGRRAAVADLGSIRLTGAIAWFAWLFVHVFFLIGFRNRVLVIMEWAWSYFFSQRGARLVTPQKE